MNVEQVRVVDVELAERDIAFRLPFRYGNTVLHAAPELHVRCKVEFPDGRADGYSAELAAPKWFDKNPALSNEQNFEQLRDATRAAARAALAVPGAMTPVQLSLATAAGEPGYRQLPVGNGLIDAYGKSLLERAVVDAVCRHRGLPLIEVFRTNRLGIDWTLLAPDISDPADRFLAALTTRDRIAVRHTVGFIDPLRSDEVTHRPDGFPVALEEVIAKDRVRYFKIKLSGDMDADLTRLRAIAKLLDATAGDYRATLDGNEQYASVASLATFLLAAEAASELSSLWQRTVFVEQPIARAHAFDDGIAVCNAIKPVIIDESDDAPDAAIRARDTGYAGISVKTCKGFYKSLINAARARQWQSGFMLSAEDLSVQAGTALAQNLALWSCLGFEHAERNGHYYGKGLDTSSSAEQEALLMAHPDLYAHGSGGTRLRIEGGDIELTSTNTAQGYGTAFAPSRADMRLLPI